MDTVPAADIRNVAYTLQVRVLPAPKTERVSVTIALPRSISGRQRLRGLHLSPDSTRWTAPGGGEYVRFDFDRPDRPRYAQLDIEADLFCWDLDHARRAAARPGTPVRAPRDLERYFAPEPMLECGDARLRRIAAGIPGEGVEGVRGVVRWVEDHLQAGGYDPRDRGALGALRTKKGDCSEFTDLAVALCRAKRIPARSWNGYLMLDAEKGDTEKHAWMEAWFPTLGWVPFDPLHVKRRMATFERLRPVYLYVSDIRRDPLLDNYPYWSYRYWGAAPRLVENLIVRKPAV